MTKPRRTQAERSETTKTDLIAAAIDCINEYGYTGATTHRIADRANVTRGALNHHFKDRMELMREVCDAVGQEFLERISKDIDKSDSIDARLQTFAYAAWSTGTQPVQLAYLELMLATKNDPELKKAVSDSLQKIDVKSLEVWLDAFSDLPVPQDVLAKLRDQLFYIQRGMAILFPFLKNDGHFEEQLSLFCDMAAQKIQVYTDAVSKARRNRDHPKIATLKQETGKRGAHRP